LLLNFKDNVYIYIYINITVYKRDKLSLRGFGGVLKQLASSSTRYPMPSPPFLTPSTNPCHDGVKKIDKKHGLRGDPWNVKEANCKSKISKRLLQEFENAPEIRLGRSFLQGNA